MSTREMDHDLFVYCRELQRRSPNLVIYSRVAGQIVETAYPLTSNGVPVLPTGMKDYVRERETFIECNCGLLHPAADHEPLSCRIVVTKATGDVIAFCNKRPSVCGMILNITAIWKSADRFSKYPHLATRNTVNGAPPPMQQLLQDFRATLDPASTAPFFYGYLGEHASFYYPGARQLAGDNVLIGDQYQLSRSVPVFGARRPRLASPPKPKGPIRYIEISDIDRPSLSAPPRIMGDHPSGGMPSRAATRVRRKPKTQTVEASTAGPSRTGHSAVGSEDTLPQDIRLLERLREGRGLTDNQWDGLAARCDECGQLFLRSKLGDHEKQCMGLILL